MSTSLTSVGPTRLTSGNMNRAGGSGRIAGREINEIVSRLAVVHFGRDDVGRTSRGTESTSGVRWRFLVAGRSHRKLFDVHQIFDGSDRVAECLFQIRHHAVLLATADVIFQRLSSWSVVFIRGFLSRRFVELCHKVDHTTAASGRGRHEERFHLLSGLYLLLVNPFEGSESRRGTVSIIIITHARFTNATERRSAR